MMVRIMNDRGDKCYKEQPKKDINLSSSRDNVESQINLLERVEIIEQNRIRDERGYLLKVLTASQCEDDFPSGEVYVTSAVGGEIKGNHYHLKMGEWFCFVRGFGELRLVDPRSKEILTIVMGENANKTVYVPPGLAHAVVNTTEDELICVALAGREHDPEDVYPYIVAVKELEVNNNG